METQQTRGRVGHPSQDCETPALDTCTSPPHRTAPLALRIMGPLRFFLSIKQGAGVCLSAQDSESITSVCSTTPVIFHRDMARPRNIGSERKGAGINRKQVVGSKSAQRNAKSFPPSNFL